MAAVEGDDAGGFLAAMLQGMQARARYGRRHRRSRRCRTAHIPRGTCRRPEGAWGSARRRYIWGPPARASRITHCGGLGASGSLGHRRAAGSGRDRRLMSGFCGQPRVRKPGGRCGSTKSRHVLDQREGRAALDHRRQRLGARDSCRTGRPVPIAAQAQITPKPAPRMRSGLLSGLEPDRRATARWSPSPARSGRRRRPPAWQPKRASSALCTSFTTSGSISWR